MEQQPPAFRKPLYFAVLAVVYAAPILRPDSPSLSWNAGRYSAALLLLAMLFATRKFSALESPGIVALLLGCCMNAAAVIGGGGAMPYISTMAPRQTWIRATGYEPALFLCDVLIDGDGGAYSVGDVLLVSGLLATVAGLVARRLTATDTPRP